MYMYEEHPKECTHTVKTTMRYCSTCIRVYIIKKIDSNKCWQGGGEIGTLTYCWWKCKLL